MGKQSCIIGYSIQPSQSLSKGITSGLHSDVISLLTSLTYHPENVEKVSLDLRYVARDDSSLIAKGLDIVLLVRIDFEPEVTQAQSQQILERFRESFSDLLALHLVKYEFGVEPLSPSEVDMFLRPFDINSVVEITRRVTSTRPFSWTKFEGSSPMSKVVDMLLRHEGETLLSVLLHPYSLSDDETRQLEVYGFQNPVVPRRQEEDLLDAIAGLQQIRRSLQSVFRMTIRLASSSPLSQYLVNLVGSEISGQRDFYYFGTHDRAELESEVIGLNELIHTLALRKVIELDIPQTLIEMVYLFQPDEAVRAFRFPTERISVAKEKTFNTYPAPVRFLPPNGIQIGVSTHPSYKNELPVRIPAKDRMRHIYILGKTGTGKSYLMLNMIGQDVQSEGVCVIDPHGELVESVFPSIPESRMNDVIYFNPSDQEYATGFNFLQTSPNADESERDYVIQEVLSMLLRSVDYDIQMFGPIARQWTRFGCMTLMELEPAGTLSDIPRLFSDDSYRREVLKRISNPIVKQWWKKEYDTMTEYRKNEIMGYFTSKFSVMVSAPQVRNIIGQQRSGIDFSRVMDDRKILLVNLSSGLLGKENSELLGSIVVSRLLWTALSRAKSPASTRRPFYLYVDEFQNFITDSFEHILSEARKYGLGLTVAHQHLDQLRSLGRMGNRIERAVFGNVGTILSFRIGGDAGTLTGEFGNPAQAADLRNLANRYAVATIQVDGIPSTPFTMKTVDWAPPTDAMIDRGNKIRETARKRGRKVTDVAKEIQERFQEDESDMLSSVRLG